MVGRGYPIVIRRGYPLGVVREGISTHDWKGISTRGGEEGVIHT